MLYLIWRHYLMVKTLISLFIIVVTSSIYVWGEDVVSSSSTVSTSTTTSTLDKLKPNDKNILWIFPNHSTQEVPEKWAPLSPAKKLSLAIDDSLDPYAIPAIAIYAGIDHWQNKLPVFGKSWSWVCPNVSQI